MKKLMLWIALSCFGTGILVAQTSAPAKSETKVVAPKPAQTAKKDAPAKPMAVHAKKNVTKKSKVTKEAAPSSKETAPVAPATK